MWGRILGVVLALLAGTACTGHGKRAAGPLRSGEASGAAMVAVAEAEPPPAHPERFACRPTAVGDQARVVFEQSFTFGGVDAKGHDVPGMSPPARATYVIALLALDARGPLRAQLELEEHEVGASVGMSQFSWTTALENGWVKLHVPVILARGDTGWGVDASAPAPALPAGSPPDAQKALDRPAFFASLGRSVELIALDVELATRLQGLLLRDVTTLAPSDNLAQRLGLKLPTPPLAREGEAVPALFASAEKAQQTVQRTTKDASGNPVPAGNQNQYLTVTREVALGADCRFRRLAVKSDVWLPLMEGQLPSGARISTGHSWELSHEGI